MSKCQIITLISPHQFPLGNGWTRTPQKVKILCSPCLQNKIDFLPKIQALGSFSPVAVDTNYTIPSLRPSKNRFGIGLEIGCLLANHKARSRMVLLLCITFACNFKLFDPHPLIHTCELRSGAGQQLWKLRCWFHWNLAKASKKN